MTKATIPMDCNTARTLLPHAIFAFVPGCIKICKVRAAEVEMWRVYLAEPGVAEVPRLSTAPKAVGKKEATRLRRMCMEVHVQQQPADVCPMQQEKLGSPNALVLFSNWGMVEAVQVEAKRIRPVMPACHSVRIQHGHKLEDELFAQCRRTRVVGEQHAQCTEERELCRCFPGMHARGEKDQRPPREVRWLATGHGQVGGRGLGGEGLAPERVGSDGEELN
mmetsp:Transcript_87177/g.247184  ORF Transcript_87177/g.247184 Transcript_87177/m.247184 type:complete len:221 (-) Transcript_87177:1310-1972(-)